MSANAENLTKLLLLGLFCRGLITFAPLLEIARVILTLISTGAGKASVPSKGGVVIERSLCVYRKASSGLILYSFLPPSINCDL